jgi:hypothetical protein
MGDLLARDGSTNAAPRARKGAGFGRSSSSRRSRAGSSPRAAVYVCYAHWQNGPNYFWKIVQIIAIDNRKAYVLSTPSYQYPSPQLVQILGYRYWTGTAYSSCLNTNFATSDIANAPTVSIYDLPSVLIRILN